MTVRSCSWCHTENTVAAVASPCLCRSCGHRADLPRLWCDCERCRGLMFLRLTLGDRPAEPVAPGLTALASAVRDLVDKVRIAKEPPLKRINGRHAEEDDDE